MEDTEEYRKIMGTLETSSQAAGYTAEQTAESYEYLYGVLGDHQQTATTISNLQAIGLAQDDLNTMLDAAIGAIPIRGARLSAPVLAATGVEAPPRRP